MGIVWEAGLALRAWQGQSQQALQCSHILGVAQANTMLSHACQVGNQPAPDIRSTNMLCWASSFCWTASELRRASGSCLSFGSNHLLPTSPALRQTAAVRY